MSQANQQDRPTLWRRPRVQQETALGKGQLYSLIRQGRFPPPVKLSDRCSAWVEDEVVAWIDARIGERNVHPAVS